MLITAYFGTERLRSGAKICLMHFAHVARIMDVMMMMMINMKFYIYSSHVCVLCVQLSAQYVLKSHDVVKCCDEESYLSTRKREKNVPYIFVLPSKVHGASIWRANAALAQSAWPNLPPTASSRQHNARFMMTVEVASDAPSFWLYE